MSAHIGPRAKGPRHGKAARQGGYPENNTNTKKQQVNDTAFLADCRRVVKRRVTDCFTCRYQHKPWVRREVRR
jgi:hypothetical protein